MKLSRAALDRTLQVLGWPLIGALALIIGNVLLISVSGNPESSFFDYGGEWMMFAFLISNFLASVVAWICIFFTPYVREARVTWFLAFLFGLALAANVVLIPLFRHYVLRKEVEA